MAKEDNLQVPHLKRQSARFYAQIHLIKYSTVIRKETLAVTAIHKFHAVSLGGVHVRADPASGAARGSFAMRRLFVFCGDPWQK